jgi:hypothetical protein
LRGGAIAADMTLAITPVMTPALAAPRCVADVTIWWSSEALV